MVMPYGRVIPDLVIHGEPAPYPVVNEREIRAAAGIMFALGILALTLVLFGGERRGIFLVLPVFWVDFLLKVIQPHYSIFGQIGGFLVRKQRPDYVGAIQKRFAWGMGLAMASTVGIFLLVGVRGTLPQVLCGMCLLFMWMESALGICVGCKIYGLLIRHQWLREPEVRPACPGGACVLKPVPVRADH